MGVEGTLELPVRHFWFLVNQLERLKAEDNRDLLDILASAQSGEGYKAAREASDSVIGKVYYRQSQMPKQVVIDDVTGLDPDFDIQGLHALKLMAGPG